MSLFQNIKFFQDNAVPGVSCPIRVARGGDGGLWSNDRIFHIFNYLISIRSRNITTFF